MEDIMEIIKFPKDFDLLIKVVCKTIENEAKEQKSGILGMLSVTLCPSLLGILLKSKVLFVLLCATIL